MRRAADGARSSSPATRQRCRCTDWGHSVYRFGQRCDSAITPRWTRSRSYRGGTGSSCAARVSLFIEDTMSTFDRLRRTTSSTRVRLPSGAVAITLTNLLTDVERDFFAREAELRDASGRVDAGAGEMERSPWRSLVALAVLASMAALASFSIVRFRPDLLGGILPGVASEQRMSPAPIVTVLRAAPAAAPPAPVAPAAIAPRRAAAVALVSTAPAAAAPAAHRAHHHHHRAWRHHALSRNKHRRS